MKKQCDARYDSMARSRMDTQDGDAEVISSWVEEGVGKGPIELHFGSA
jgi:hypothetical protein